MTFLLVFEISNIAQRLLHIQYIKPGFLHGQNFIHLVFKNFPQPIKLFSLLHGLPCDPCCAQQIVQRLLKTFSVINKFAFVYTFLLPQHENYNNAKLRTLSVLITSFSSLSLCPYSCYLSLIHAIYPSTSKSCFLQYKYLCTSAIFCQSDVAAAAQNCCLLNHFTQQSKGQHLKDSHR